MLPGYPPSHVVAAKVVTGELGARLGLSDQDLALVTSVLAAGAHGWRAFECETLDADGTYVGTVRLTTHPAVGTGGTPAAGGIVAAEPGDAERAPKAALRRARPKRSPAQTRVRAALERAAAGAPGAPSDLEWRKGDPERLDEPAPPHDPAAAPGA